jgi:hypothetical protein
MDLRNNPTASKLRGLRNNNPFNIMFDPKIKWVGQVGKEVTAPFRLIIFDSVENGIRAVAKDVAGDYLKDGKHTIKALISEYAPPSDGNNTSAYIEYVSRVTGIPANEPFEMSDDILTKILLAIGTQESGSLTWQLIPTSTVGEVVRKQNFQFKKKVSV